MRRVVFKYVKFSNKSVANLVREPEFQKRKSECYHIILSPIIPLNKKENSCYKDGNSRRYCTRFTYTHDSIACSKKQHTHDKRTYITEVTYIVLLTLHSFFRHFVYLFVRMEFPQVQLKRTRGNKKINNSFFCVTI